MLLGRISIPCIIYIPFCPNVRTITDFSVLVTLQLDFGFHVTSTYRGVLFAVNVKM